jgi:uncharacterized protein (TIGR00730 family)
MSEPGSLASDSQGYSYEMKKDTPQELAKRIPSPAMNAEDSRRAYKAIETSLRELWSVVDGLSNLLPPRPTYYRVTIFGSSRMNPGDELYGEVRNLAERLSNLGCDIITGGGPGLMQAANEGERIGDVTDQTYSIGLNVELPHEQGANPYVEKLYHHGTFFSRLHHFVQLSSAFVVMPGGIGTTLEALLVWQLIQVGHLQNRPLIFVGKMWRDLVAWGDTHWINGGRHLVDQGDLAIPVCVDTVDEACRVIEENLKWWAETVETESTD